MLLRLHPSMLVALFVTASSSVAQSATLNDYLFMKSAVETYSDKTKIYKPGKDGELGGNCNEFAAMTGLIGTEMDGALADIAGKVVFWSNELTALGYPSSISKDLVGQIEHDLVTNLLNGRYHKQYGFYDIDFGKQVDRLIDAGDKYRASNNSHLKRLFVDPTTSCGAGGEAEVTFTSSPSGAQISVIPEFNYELCKAHGDTSLTGCTAWRRVNSTGAGRVSSVYYVYVKWSGRTSGPTRYDLSRAKDGQKIVVGD